MSNNNKILITGGAGFIGSHLANALIRNGFHITVLDDLSSGKKKYLSKKIKFIKGDIKNLNTCNKYIKGVDQVIHLAAMSRTGASIEIGDINYCLNQNVIGTSNVLQACVNNKINKIIYASSSSYYGNLPIPHKIINKSDFLNSYSLSKHLGEMLIEYFSKIYGINYFSLRLFNVYGPRQPMVGNYALVIGIFLNALKLNKPLMVHGRGKQKRDFIHVNDVVSCFIQAINSKLKNKKYNVGSGKNISIINIAKKISKKIKYIERRIGDSENTLADIKSTMKDLNWEPKVSFNEGLEDLKMEILK